MSVRILLSTLLVCVVVANGQLLNRRQPFNLARQQKQLESQQQQQQQDAVERQSSAQLLALGDAVDNPPVNRATFERLFEVIRMISELLQTLSAIRARFTSEPATQAASYNIPTYLNSQ